MHCKDKNITEFVSSLSFYKLKELDRVNHTKYESVMDIYEHMKCCKSCLEKIREEFEEWRLNLKNEEFKRLSNNIIILKNMPTERYMQ